MYTERDFEEIRALLRRGRLALALALAALLGLYAMGLALGIAWLAYAAGAAAVVAGLYLFLTRILPRRRYLRFLLDIREGGSHEFSGTVTDRSETAEPQDGAMVLPVHVMLDAPAEERTYYLNVSKAGDFPAVGERVRMRCFGRHIIERLEPEEVSP